MIVELTARRYLINNVGAVRDRGFGNLIT